MSGLKDTLGDRPFSAPAKDSLPWLAEQINLKHQAVFQALVRGIDHALNCGALLNVAKRKVRHGDWGTWLAENCPAVAERQAQRYMRLADHADLIKAKSDTVSDLTLREATKLISSSKRRDEPVLPAPEPPVEPEPQSGFAPSTPVDQAPLAPYAESDMPDLPPNLDRRAGPAPSSAPSGWDATMAIQADIQAGNPRLEPASSGASPPGAVAFASRMLTDLYEQAVLKDVDPCEVARGLELEPEQKIELFTWITHVAITQRFDEAASRARHRGA